MRQWETTRIVQYVRRLDERECWRKKKKKKKGWGFDGVFGCAEREDVPNCQWKKCVSGPGGAPRSGWPVQITCPIMSAYVSALYENTKHPKKQRVYNRVIDAGSWETKKEISIKFRPEHHLMNIKVNYQRKGTPKTQRPRVLWLLFSWQKNNQKIWRERLFLSTAGEVPMLSKQQSDQSQ